MNIKYLTFSQPFDIDSAKVRLEFSAFCNFVAVDTSLNVYVTKEDSSVFLSLKNSSNHGICIEEWKTVSVDFNLNEGDIVRIKLLFIA